jgi:5-methylcytosine-specific restriction protein A
MRQACIVCGRPSSGRRCPTHALRERLPGWDWQRLSARVLSRDPVCRICRRRPSVTADHIVRVADGGSDDELNLRGVCGGCHADRHR